MTNALQTQVSRDFAPIWQVDCNLLLLDDATADANTILTNAANALKK